MPRRLLALVIALLAAPASAVAAPATPSGTLARQLEAHDVRADDVRALHRTTSLGSHVTRLRQLAGGVPVLGGEVVVVDAPGRGGDLVVDGRRRVRTPGRARVARVHAVAAARARIGARALRAAPAAALFVAPNGTGGRLVWRVLLASRRPLGSYEVLVDARTGDVVRVRDRLRRATGSAAIFDPNPVTMLGGTAGLADFDDLDSPALTAARKAVILERLTFADGCLTGRWVRAILLGGQVCAAGADFSGVTRSDDRFEAVMAYFHLDRTRAYLESLGFGTLLASPLQVVANATDETNAYYDPFTHEIGLGTGDIDAGEDADAVVHEYGHAIQDAQVPGFGEGREAGALGEGFGDYLAATIADNAAPGSPFAPCIAEWWSFGFGGGACLRRVDGDLAVRDVGVGTACDGQIHCAGAAWSGVLWDIRAALGAPVADRLVIQSHYALTVNASFTDAARALIAADGALNGGANQQFLQGILSQRGFLDAERLDDSPVDAKAFAVPARVEGRIDAPAGDRHDVYAVPLTAGTGVTFRITSTGGELELRLYGPGTTSLSEVSRIIGASGALGSSFSLTTVARETGTHYLDVSAITGAGTYVLESSPDGDSDGTPDLADNCATTSNPNQSDVDRDGAGDVCDRFPVDPENDKDGDGLGASEDNCPAVANPSQADWNGDNRGDACDTRARVALTRVRTVGRSLAVAGLVRPATLSATAVRVLVERAVCSGRRCRWARVSSVGGIRQATPGVLSLRIRVARPGRYRLRAVLRDARFRAPASPWRAVRVR